jgi:hypothetical protein
MSVIMLDMVGLVQNVAACDAVALMSADAMCTMVADIVGKVKP